MAVSANGKIAWTNVTTTLGALEPWADNPRFSTKAQAQRLLDSWKALGQFQTVAVGPPDESGRHPVYDGHQRLSALLTLYGPDYAIDARQSDRALSDEERRHLALAANLAAGQWDWNKLAAWPTQELTAWGMDAEQKYVWDSDALNLKEMLRAEEPTADEKFVINEAPRRVKPGEIWRLGRHRIACIDCLDIEQVKHFIGDDQPTFVFSDPPYGISIVDVKGYVGGELSTTFHSAVKKKQGSVGGAKPFGSKAARGADGSARMVAVGLYAPVAGDDAPDTALKAFRIFSEFAPKAIHIWWGANHYAHGLPSSPCWIVWDKRGEYTNNFADAELAWCSKQSTVRIFRHLWNGLMKESERGERRVHPTQKPIALAEWCFEKYGQAHDVIFDPFLGSGISLLAAERMEGKRTVLGCELSPEYCDWIIQRMADAFPGIEIERLAT